MDGWIGICFFAKTIQKFLGWPSNIATIGANGKEIFIKIQKYNKHLNMSGVYLLSREASTFQRDFYRENRKQDEKETVTCFISCG